MRIVRPATTRGAPLSPRAPARRHRRLLRRRCHRHPRHHRHQQNHHDHRCPRQPWWRRRQGACRGSGGSRCRSGRQRQHVTRRSRSQPCVMAAPSSGSRDTSTAPSPAVLTRGSTVRTPHASTIKTKQDQLSAPWGIHGIKGKTAQDKEPPEEARVSVSLCRSACAIPLPLSPPLPLTEAPGKLRTVPR